HVRRAEAALNGESMFSGFYEPKPRTSSRTEAAVIRGEARPSLPVGGSSHPPNGPQPTDCFVVCCSQPLLYLFSAHLCSHAAASHSVRDHFARNVAQQALVLFRSGRRRNSRHDPVVGERRDRLSIERAVVAAVVSRAGAVLYFSNPLPDQIA